MTAEIERFQEAWEAQQQGSVQPTSSLERWAADAMAVTKIAGSIAQTSFLPFSYKKNVRPEQWQHQACAAILAGHEVGLSPMASLQSIEIIEGRPALSALAQRGLVQAAGHEVWIEEQTPNSCTWVGQRKGSEHVMRSTWTLERAKQARLLSKDNWANHPGAMMSARASSEVCRLIAADVLLGLAYSAEELQDEVLGEHEQQGSTPMQRRAVKQAAEEKPALPAAEQDATEAADEAQAAAVQPEEEWPGDSDVPHVYEAMGPGTDAASRSCKWCGMHQDEEGNLHVEADSEAGSEDDVPEIAFPEEEEREEESASCGTAKPGDPTQVCSRPAGHSGRHYYGRSRKVEETELPAEEAVIEPEDEGIPSDAVSENPPARQEEQPEQQQAQPTPSPMPSPALEDDPWADFG